MEEVLIELLNHYGLMGVLLNSLLSYSILPLPSEVAIIIASQIISPFWVFLFALIGSTIGSITNYILGLKGIRLFFKKENTKREKQAKKLIEKYGPASLVLFTWMPFIGDPLIILAGAIKMDFNKFLVYSTLGKVWYFILVIWFSYVIPFQI